MNDFTWAALNRLFPKSVNEYGGLELARRHFYYRQQVAAVELCRTEIEIEKGQAHPDLMAEVVSSHDEKVEQARHAITYRRKEFFKALFVEAGMYTIGTAAFWKAWMS